MTSVCLAAEFSCELLDLMPGMWAMNTWACEMKSFARYYVLFHVLLLHKYNLIATYQTYHKWWWFLDISLWVLTALFQLAHVCVCVNVYLNTPLFLWCLTKITSANYRDPCLDPTRRLAAFILTGDVTREQIVTYLSPEVFTDELSSVSMKQFNCSLNFLGSLFTQIQNDVWQNKGLKAFSHSGCRVAAPACVIVETVM